MCIPWKTTVVSDGDIRTVSCKVTRSLAVIAEIRLAEQMVSKRSRKLYNQNPKVCMQANS